MMTVGLVGLCHQPATPVRWCHSEIGDPKGPIIIKGCDSLPPLTSYKDGEPQTVVGALARKTAGVRSCKAPLNKFDSSCLPGWCSSLIKFMPLLLKPQVF